MTTKAKPFRPQRRNANRHTTRGLDMLGDAMRRSGYVAPMTAAADGEIIDGSARLDVAAGVFGEAEPLVIDHDGSRPIIMRRTDIPTADDPRAVRISLEANRIAAADLEWDEGVLAEWSEDDPALLEGLWTDDELAEVLAGIEADAPPEVADAEPQVDRAAELAEQWGTKAGQVWALGNHRLAVGDCTDAGVVARLMDGERAAMMWSDPPYGVSYVGKTKAAMTIQNDGAGGLRELLDGCLASAPLEPGAPWYIAAPPGPRCLDFLDALGAAGWQLHQMLVWVKDVMVLGHSDYHYRHELILYGWLPGPGRSGRGAHEGTRWQGDNAQTSVFEVPRPTRSEDHPTMKPVELVVPMIQNSSRPGAVVYEPFSGSGTTIIAAERLGRRCYAVEIDPGYAAVAIQRWVGATGGEPRIVVGADE